ncbi:MAG: hypothetical protein J0H71_05365 [Rhizobiales bacterium]|nr:hypothetical protein [Hyphomicrobiales bacterium]
MAHATSIDPTQQFSEASGQLEVPLALRRWRWSFQHINRQIGLVFGLFCNRPRTAVAAAPSLGGMLPLTTEPANDAFARHIEEDHRQDGAAEEFPQRNVKNDLHVVCRPVLVSATTVPPPVAPDNLATCTQLEANVILLEWQAEKRAFEEQLAAVDAVMSEKVPA